MGVDKALAISGLSPENLEIELTESVLIADLEGVMQTLSLLSEKGIRIAIDDFGTGYSSLSYLKKLSVDKLKIDGSFVRDMVEDSDDAAIVQAIIQMGHTLKLQVIAEGVETDRQLALLRQYGCDQIQGYLYSKPCNSAEFEQQFFTETSLRS